MPKIHLSDRAYQAIKRQKKMTLRQAADLLGRYIDAALAMRHYESMVRCHRKRWNDPLSYTKSLRRKTIAEKIDIGRRRRLADVFYNLQKQGKVKRTGPGTYSLVKSHPSTLGKGANHEALASGSVSRRPVQN